MGNILYELNFFDLFIKKMELMKQNHFLKIGFVIFLKRAPLSDFVDYTYIIELHALRYPNLYSAILGIGGGSKNWATPTLTQSFVPLVKIGCARARTLRPKKGWTLARVRDFGFFALPLALISG